MAADPLSRRDLLTAGGAAATLFAGGALARRSLPGPDGPTLSGWPMAGADPAGTCYAPDAEAPTDGVAVRWKHRITVTRSDRQPSPVVADGVVFAVLAFEPATPIGSSNGELLAVGAADGERLGRICRNPLTAAAVAPGRAYRTPTAAVLETPTVESPRLVGVDGRPDESGGDNLTRWTASVDGSPDGSGRVLYGGADPPPVSVGDRFLAVYRGHLVSVDASSGAVEWTSDDTLVATRPAVRDGTAYVRGPEAGIRGYDVTTGEWAAVEVDLPGAPLHLTATPESLLVAGHGWVADVVDGDVAWRASFEGGDVPAGPLAVANGTVYARRPTASGARLCALDGSDGSVLWVADDVAIDTGDFLPAVADGVVAVPTHGSLAGVDPADGSVRWRFEPPLGRCSPAAIAGDAVYVLVRETLYALEEA
ncbi:MAG: PQQ-binding-like beta-propeller repeat protein [Halococcoides sp.]